MADNRKYYYLKLKENFFDSDSIVLLEDMKDGILYSNILLKLYLKSLKNGGRLQLDEHIPYTAQMIATLTRHQIGTVERALAIFQQLGLVEQLDCGLLYMTDIELMIGQSSTEAERKRAARLENKALLPPRTNGGHLSDIRPPEIEIKKEIDIELEKEGELKGQAPARRYGRYNNVFLSDTELDELKAELPDKWEYYIDRLSTHIASKGTKYRSHGKDEICYGGDLKVMSDDFADITTYSTTIYINGSEKETLLSNGVDDQTGGTIDVSGNIGKISGDILRDSDADKLTDNLWFELKTTNLSGEENTYQVQLETTEITKEVKK